jgi:alkylated DNA repair dioxygenase AlkB
MPRHASQDTLFDLPLSLPEGLLYRPDFLTEREEWNLLDAIGTLEMVHPKTEGYAAKRRVAGFGWGYDFERKRLIPGPPLPEFLKNTQRKIAKWLDVPVGRVAEALVTEYEPGAAIGWHRDNEPFEAIVGISLSGWAKMRFRPFGKASPKNIIAIDLEPRSAYLMHKDVRWRYQHSVEKTKLLRYSVTFRTLPKMPRV